MCPDNKLDSLKARMLWSLQVHKFKSSQVYSSFIGLIPREKNRFLWRVAIFKAINIANNSRSISLFQPLVGVFPWPDNIDEDIWKAPSNGFYRIHLKQALCKHFDKLLPGVSKHQDIMKGWCRLSSFYLKNPSSMDF